MLNISRRPRMGRSSSSDPSRHRLAAMPVSSCAVNLRVRVRIGFKGEEHDDRGRGQSKVHDRDTTSRLLSTVRNVAHRREQVVRGLNGMYACRRVYQTSTQRELMPSVLGSTAPAGECP